MTDLQAKVKYLEELDKNQKEEVYISFSYSMAGMGTHVQKVKPSKNGRIGLCREVTTINFYNFHFVSVRSVHKWNKSSRPKVKPNIPEIYVLQLLSFQLFAQSTWSSFFQFQIFLTFLK